MMSESVAGGAQERHWALAAHLCGLLWLLGGTGLLFLPFGALALFTVLGPLIIWRAKQSTLPFAAAQALESLNFQITMWLLGMLFAALTVILIGFALLWLLGLWNLVQVVIAAIRVNDGNPYRYPYCLRLVR